MALIKKLLERFNGLHYPQDYLCFAKGSFQPVLHVYLVVNGQVVKNITASHLFTGYSPVLFTFFSIPETGETMGTEIELLFSHEDIKTYDVLPASVALAGLTLKRIRQIQAAGGELSFYEGVHGWHRFIPGWQQWISQLHNKLYNRKPGNVFLAGNLYKQVQLAYAVPRKISLITVGEQELYNHFPTDLHGAAGEGLYVISLRHAGRACKQVESAGRIVLSDIEASVCKEVFGLGKNHMQPLKEKEEFDLSEEVSGNFQLPLPNGLIAYTELELISSFRHGIHKLLLFKIIYRRQAHVEAGTLMHIHNSYASWRHKKGMKSNYILR